MRSRAMLASHPLHPILVPFPLAFLTGAVAFDLLGVWLGDPSWWTTGSHLLGAGILMALLAAVPGFIDYWFTVPPRSSESARALKHLGANQSSVALFTVAWALRGTPASPPSALVLGIETLAALGLFAGAWMGGTLVVRNQIGIDHRYAGAGKWREETIAADGGRPLVVARAGELQADQMKLLHVDGRRIVLARTERGFAAFEDRCPHRGGSLAGGSLIGGVVQCPWHGSQFDVKDGSVEAGPAKKGIEVYRVKVEGEVVELTIGGS